MTVAASLESASYESLELAITDEILTITISRPAALNALSEQVVSELIEVVDLLTQLGTIDDEGAADWSIRGVIFTGAGDKSFVAGADIVGMTSMNAERIREYTQRAQALTANLETLPVPVIAAVNGFALGGGCELALACDLIFAQEQASFGQPEVALGLIPGFGGTVRLQRTVGPQLAKDLIFSGRRVSATEAHEMGLATRLYPTKSELLQGAEEYLALVKQQSPIAVARAKQSVNATAHQSATEGLNTELGFFVECFETDDMREGTAAFVEKRAAAFTGK